jgi:hypothetical protein
MEASKKQFKGFRGITNKNVPCWVMNAVTMKNGEPGYRVKLGRIVGYAGDHTVYPVIDYDGQVGSMYKYNVKRQRS